MYINSFSAELKRLFIIKDKIIKHSTGNVTFNLIDIIFFSVALFGMGETIKMDEEATIKSS